MLGDRQEWQGGEAASASEVRRRRGARACYKFEMCFPLIRPRELVLSLVVLSAATGVSAQTAGDGSSAAMSARAVAMRHRNALLPVDWDARSGKLYLGVPLPGKGGMASPSYILADSLPYGVGQNDLGMDRGQLQVLSGIRSVGGPRLVHFERVGPKLLLVQENTAFRTASMDPAEVRAVAQSFPSSVLAGFKIEGEAESLVVVDATDFFLKDIHGVAETLAEAKQGTYKVDPNRSTIVPESTRDFPENTCIEAQLTLVTDDASKARTLADVTPDVHALTVHERQSFLKLPEPGFVPRRFSPRAGYFETGYREMNAPLGGEVDQQFVTRFRLQKKDPSCANHCEAIKPIHYYVDRGAPEPLRAALIEGCRWWDQAFQAAGWAKGTFLVDELPADADPMDARYNIIQWVHRFNRGWSYGSEIADPRTGEILKGNVTLGSLRGRQDYLIAEALLAPYKDGKRPDAAQDEALSMVLARIRQLAAHETGHTLGLAHNYAASTMPHEAGQTMSVMEYPHPWITLNKSGVPDLRHAYPVNIGVWDKVAIDYGYREFDRGGKPVEEAKALDAILRTAEAQGNVYLTDADARPLGSASPVAHLWDSGTDAADELNRVLEVRAAALKRFGEDTIVQGTASAQMEDKLVPLYLLHRYQAEAATKIVGGLDYRYTVRGDGQGAPKIVPAEEQRKALAAVAKTLSPEVLTLPEALLRQFPPRPPGLPRNAESFPSHTSLTFDPVATAEGAADLTLAVLFHPARANRLVEYHAREGSQPTLSDVIQAALRSAGSDVAASTLSGVVSTAVEARVIEALFRLAKNADTSFAARSIVTSELHTFAQAQGEGAAGALFKRRITAFENEPERFEPEGKIEVPPGMPIGEDDLF
ncbi:MAG: zinc-dependent metalloprotease [Acidobacteriaceae bacterium]